MHKACTMLDLVSGNDHYADTILESIKKHWDKSSGDSQTGFVFTSSAGVYAENAGGVVNEGSEVKHSPYTDQILGGESHVLAAGGSVVRLGGLFTVNRGAHNFWLTSGRPAFTSAPNGLINLISYHDAALISVDVLHAAKDVTEGKLYLVSDGVPISRVGICEAAIANPKYAECKVPKFEGDPGLIDGKKYDTGLVRKSLGWAPVFPSFAEYMKYLYVKDPPCKLLDE